MPFRLNLYAIALSALFGCTTSNPLATIDVELSTPAIRAGQLVESIGIETIGGVFTPLLTVGCSIPCEITRTFSTAADNQTEISLTLFRGSEAFAKDNHRLGTFVVVGIPELPRGIPLVAITFRVDRESISLVATETTGAAIGLRRK